MTFTTLRALEARLAETKRSDREIDCKIEQEIVGNKVRRVERGRKLPSYNWRTKGGEFLPSYTSSLDAAVALVERICPLPKYQWAVKQSPHRKGYFVDLSDDKGRAYLADAPTAPLALLLALVRALIAKGEK